MTDDSLPEFDVGGNVREEKKTADEGISIIRVVSSISLWMLRTVKSSITVP
jgi:hypothetical protein